MTMLLRCATPMLLLAEVARAQFQFEIPAGMFEQMHGMPQGGRSRGAPRETLPQGIDEAFNWLKATNWNWNDWREVRFGADGRFEAPTPDCERGQCRWSTDKNTVYIRWGDSGLHKVKANAMVAAAGTTLKGKRLQDGEKCSAAFLSKDERDEDLDLYEVLGLDDEVEQKGVKQAYRRLSLKYHPDKCAGMATVQVGDVAEEVECSKMMNRVNLAYEVLGDEDKRILYDTGGLESVKEGIEEDSGGGMDPFSMLFGGGGPRKRSKKGPDARVELVVTLDDMYLGNVVDATISRRVVCRKCAGRIDGKCAACGRCPNEVKTVQREMRPGMVVQQQEEVASKEKCKSEETTLKAHVEQGMAAGAEVKFPRMSEQLPGQIPGDVVVLLKQAPHARFTRKGQDLHMDMVITLKEALLGFSKTFDHLDGRKVTVSADRVTKPAEVQRVQGEGMPVHNFPSEHGDLFVKFQFKMPNELTAAQKDAVASLF
ncbi:DnaJ C terminal domain-containing protein [Pelagophyceae sp. CCMP2097]|nr:DnaJ C terminal domain-containing protein [Pelagophyceae sp. CCMP2097]